MKVLIIKTSSMGDVIHTLPALTDATREIPDVQFDWVVEEAFAAIPAWHPAVDRVIPVALRRWRKNIIKVWLSGEWTVFKGQLNSGKYDCVIDAQGLLKSALITRTIKAPRYGFDKQSAREGLSAKVLSEGFAVARNKHAVERVRELFAKSLGYEVPEGTGNYRIVNKELVQTEADDPYLVFLHGTTWPSKRLPESHWEALAKMAKAQGLGVRLPWGNEEEERRAKRLASTFGGEVLPRMNLQDLGSVLAGAKGVISVDSGLGHLATALEVPCVTLYGPTDAALTGGYGGNQKNLVADFQCSPCLKKKCFLKEDDPVYPPCFGKVTPERVWSELMELL